MIDYTSKYISKKIGLNLKTLNNISIGEFDKKYSDIYSLTSHEYRYSALSTVLKIMAIPLVAVSNVVKILSGEIVAMKQLGNIPLMILQKMDQGISKKILQGLDDTNEEELCDITSNILQKWQDDVELIPQQEQGWFSSIKHYLCENLPFVAAIKNFWVNGGVHYTKQQLEGQHLVKQITKEIFKLSYIVGKEAITLSSDDIYNHFKAIGAYKENMSSKEIDLFQHQWFNNNYDTWDVGYFSDDDTMHLMGGDNGVN